MRYVTEDELRAAYGREPFSSYRLSPDTRLTPSARQFLIDFRVSFEGGKDKPSPNALGHQASCRVSQTTVDSLDGLVRDVNLLGTRLRRLARGALGVDNAFAHRADELGRSWQSAHMLGELPKDATGSGAGEGSPGPTPAPALEAAICPIFFDMACVHAEIRRCAYAWERLQTTLGPDESECVRAWIAEATFACKLIEGAISHAEEEV